MTEEGTYVKSPRTPDHGAHSAPLALWNAAAIVKAHGLRRSLPLLALMIIAGFLEGIGVVSMLPVLAIVTSTPAGQNPSMLQSLVEQGAAFLHIPLALEPLCALMAATIVAKAVLNLVVARQLGRAGARIAEDLRAQLIAALMRAKWSYFTVQPVGRFVAAATSEANWASAAFRSAMRVLEQLTRTIILCAIAILMGWQMALIAIGMGVLTGFSLRSLSRAAYIAGRQRRLATSRIVEEIGDIMAGFKPLKAMNRHSRMFGELAKDARKLRRAVNALVLNEGLLAQLPDFVQITLFAICAYLAARLVGAPIDTIVVAGVLSFALTGNVVRVRRALIQLAQAESTYTDLQDTIAEASQAAEQLNGTQPPTLEVGCEFRGVSFSYGRGPVLSGANMLVPAHQITTLVGPSGIGKTTIADLLLGLYVPTAGTVLIDGVDITMIDIVKWRSMVGYVSQEIILFNDTILANVVLGDEGIDEARVLSALEAAGLAELIAELPGGLMATIGERGLKLSGGQRQRLALARALVHRPKLLILDEATSALDPATEEEICSAIAAQAQDLTIFAITHQRSWIERSDNIYLVDNGKLRRVTREELRQAPAEAR